MDVKGMLLNKKTIGASLVLVGAGVALGANFKIMNKVLFSAGASGHGVTQWYAESNQSGFIGNFVAGAEGHGSVLGQ